MLKFDLSTNPFVILELPQTANVRQVSDAIQDAIDDGVLSEDEAVRVRQVLTTPNLRLEAELSSLPDVDRKLARDLQAQLRQDHQAEDLLPYMERLHSLPRSNLLAHLNSKFGGNHTTLRQLLNAQEACAAGGITEAMNESREQSTLPAVTRPAVEAGLRALFVRQLQGAVDGFADAGLLADQISRLTSDMVRETKTFSERLDVLLPIFGQAIEGELSRRGEEVRAACDTIKIGPRNEDAYRHLADAISAWLRLTAPLQTVEAAKGRDDPRTRQMYETVNDLGIWLTNEKGDNPAALRVLQLARKAFDALPRAVEQIEANIGIVEGNVAWSHVEPLMSFADSVTNDSLGLNADLLKGGFGMTSVGVAKQLFGLFQQAERASRGTEGHAQAWLAIRGLAITLTNDFNMPGASQELLAGLRSYAKKNPAPAALAGQLKADWLTTSDNVAFETITNHVKAGRLKKAQAACEVAIAATRNDDNRANFSAIRDSLRKRRTVKTLKGLGWAAVAVVMIYAIVEGNRSSPPRRTAATSSYTTYSAQPEVEAAYLESIPAVSASERTFTRANIRYCRYQDVRLEAARDRASSEIEIEKFNSLVDYFNSRCGNYRYRQGDWDAITSELHAKRGQLASEGRMLLQ